MTSGAGAAALACLNLLVSLGAKRENIWVTDIEGVVYEGRPTLMDRWKSVYAQATEARTLADVIEGADVFLGLSAAGVLKPHLLAKMAPRPLILALANPTPEIMPELAEAERPDAMICTGRSDYPNQVNNVLCFPYIFRGALDVGACTINEAMKAAAVKAIAGARPRGALGGGRARLRRRSPSVRAEVADPEPLRPAPDPAHRPGGGGGRHGLGRRRAPARRSSGLRRQPDPLRVPLRLHHAAALPARRRPSRSASSTPRARTSGCCAPRRPSWRRGSRARSWSGARAWSRRASSASASRSSRDGTSSSSTRRTIRATATTSRPTCEVAGRHGDHAGRSPGRWRAPTPP